MQFGGVEAAPDLDTGAAADVLGDQYGLSRTARLCRTGKAGVTEFEQPEQAQRAFRVEAARQQVEHLQAGPLRVRDGGAHGRCVGLDAPGGDQMPAVRGRTVPCRVEHGYRGQPPHGRGRCPR